MTDDGHTEALDLATQRTLTAANTAAAAPVARIEPDDLLRHTRDVIETAIHGYPVFDNDGVEVGTVQNGAVALRGIELLMKASGMLTEHKQVEHVGAVEVRIVGVDTGRLT
jgi:sporulation protein YlmC with PRC-barrel domain